MPEIQRDPVLLRAHCELWWDVSKLDDFLKQSAWSDWSMALLKSSLQAKKR